MKTPHDLISDLEQALNSRDEEGLIGIFAEDALIRDGAFKFSGPAGMRRWVQTSTKIGLELAILGISGEGTEWQFEALVSGAFEGSPVLIDHHLTIKDGTIAQLVV